MSRYVTSKKRNSGEQQRDRSERESVGAADAVELVSQETGQHQRNDRANDQAGEGQDEGLPQHELVDLAFLRAECHANSDLARALSRGVGNNSVDADSSQQHGEEAKGAGENSSYVLQDGAKFHS